MDSQKLLRIAYQKAEDSRNPSTRNGALLVNDEGEVLVSASNTLTPDGVLETEERKVKPLRLKFSVHAERNVIYQAAKLGIKTEGLTMVCGWATCGDCAQGIIQAGIKALITHKQALDKNGSWAEEVKLGFVMLKEAGVKVEIYDGEIGGVKVLRNDEYWEP